MSKDKLTVGSKEFKDRFINFCLLKGLSSITAQDEYYGSIFYGEIKETDKKNPEGFAYKRMNRTFRSQI